MKKRDSSGKFIKQKNTYEILDKIVKCYSEDGDLLFIADVDIYDEISKFSWGKYANGYCATYINGKCVPIHRLITNAPKGKVVDHINGDKKDNTISNLRICDKSQNAFNTGLNSNNTSGVKGVWYRKDTNKWVAEIKVNGKKKSLGCYAEKEDAIRVRKEAEIEYAKEFRREI